MTNTPFNNKILDTLSPKEREIAIKALQELSQGNSKTLDSLKWADYEEVTLW